MDKKVIPRGLYCYDKKGTCPYWQRHEDRPEQENGFCLYLGKGDWEINREKRPLIEIVSREPNGHRTTTYYYNVSPHDLGFADSLLWDKCKECNIKMTNSWWQEYLNEIFY